MNAFDYICFISASFLIFLLWLTLSKSEKHRWSSNASIYTNSTAVFHESFIPWGGCQYVFWKVCFVGGSLMLCLLIMFDFNLLYNNSCLCLFLNYNISVNILSSITFNFVICFSFSMLLHGLTLGENDGDLEVCNTSLSIFQICMAS
jgi:hypothetical protein